MKTMHNFPLMLCLAYNDRDVYCPLAYAIFLCDENGVFAKISAGAGRLNECSILKSIDGTEVEMSELNCKSYSELFVALDLNDLIHGKTSSLDINKSLAKSYNELKASHAELERKYNSTKSLLDSITTKIDDMSNIMSSFNTNTLSVN